MGQKVSPVGMRVGINRDWHSRWFASDKNFAKFLHEDIKIRKYISKKCKAALVSHVEIERRKAFSKNGEFYKVEVKVFVSQSGVVIGQGGENIKAIKDELVKLTHISAENLEVTVIGVEEPNLDAYIVAQKIAIELENRASFRTAQKKAIKEVMKAGAKGCRTMISGRLGGADIARSEGYKEGIIPLTTLRSNIDFAIAEAVTPYGRLGVKVWICKGNANASKSHQEKKGA